MKCNFNINKLVSNLGTICNEPFDSEVHKIARDLYNSASVGYSTIYKEYYFFYKSSIKDIDIIVDEKYNNVDDLIEGVEKFFINKLKIKPEFDRFIGYNLVDCSITDEEKMHNTFIEIIIFIIIIFSIIILYKIN